MKADESTPTPTPTPQTPAPVVQTYTSQWASTPIQQPGQHPTASYYQPYTSHYPQAAYATHYQAYAPPQTPTATTSTTQQQQAAAARPTTTTPAPTAAYQTSTYNLSTAAANTTTTANAASSSSNNNSGGMDTADVATLNDALGSAGVDLRAEEESLQRSSDLSHPLTSSLHHSHSYHRPYEDRTRKAPQPPHCFPTHVIGPTMRTVATNHKVTRVTDDAVNYLALALRARIHDLIKGMVAAARHRTDAQFDRPAHFYGDENAVDPAATAASTSATAVIKIEVDGELVPAPASDKPKDRTPMWSIVIRKDISKQLAALEKIEREEELRARKERKERAELTAAHAAALAAQASGMASGSTAYGAGAAGGAAGSSAAGAGAAGGDGDDGDGGANPKKKRKKDGPGVTARNMSEDVRKKMSNAVASQAAGLGGRYSWMTAANAGAAATPVKPKPATTTTTTPSATTTPAPTGTSGGDAAAAGTGTGSTGTAAAAATTPTSSWARPYIPTKKPGFSSSLASSGTTNGTANGTGGKEGEGDAESKKISVTMRDAMFVVEKERGHGAGRGAARGWV
ncbi:hypothetical protein JR316_0004268 [Psilocybe cubensis]|uniref:Uncharacterized protein n=2 Tax=Psilocybe cubensis TaxID=181762 RepID=A0ACB8H2Z8_PSICU|nr:hypothetical protein JR316_0004268 [Psilocybe cubensis]KAH9482173.1 hypothetical protein JR316_0004268 [Psilocybe cubensis]